LSVVFGRSLRHHPRSTARTMSSYDFTSLRSRQGTDSLKWQKYRDRDVLPMWVADMDFHAAPEIVDAVQRRARDGGRIDDRVPGHGERRSLRDRDRNEQREQQ